MIQPRSFPPNWKGYFHRFSAGAGLGFFGDGRGAGTAPHTPEKGLLGTSLLEAVITKHLFFDSAESLGVFVLRMNNTLPEI